MEDIKHPDKQFNNDSANWCFSTDKDELSLNSKLTRPPPHTGKTGEILNRTPCQIGHQLVVQIIQIIEDYGDEKGDIESEKLVEDRRWAVFLDDLLELHLVCHSISLVYYENFVS